MIQRLKDFRTLIKTTIADYKYNKHHLAIRKSDSLEIEFANLRKYCHMLDKAMNNPRFEKGHSDNIYREAVSLKDKLEYTYEKDIAYQWACGIINRFERAQQSGKPEIFNNEPRVFSEEEIAYLKEFIRNRTSCRNFKKQLVPSSVIREIVTLAVDAPNGCCQQSTRFYFTQDACKIRELAPNIAGLTNFTNVQCLVAVCADCSHYGLNDKNLQYVDASLATENFILAAQLFGIYGTMCNFFHAAPEQIVAVKNLLNVKECENIILFIALGYPVVLPEKPTRRNFEVFYKEA